MTFSFVPPRLLAVGPLAFSGLLLLSQGAAAQSCVLPFDPAGILAPPLQVGAEVIQKTAVDRSGQFAALVTSTSGTERVQSIRIFDFDAVADTFAQTGSIDIDPGAIDFRGADVEVAIEGDTVVIFSGPSTFLAQATSQVFYRTGLSTSTPQNDQWTAVGSLLDAANAVMPNSQGVGGPSLQFGADIDLVTINGRVYAYVGDRQFAPSLAAITGAVWVFDATYAGAIPVGGGIALPTLAGFITPPAGASGSRLGASVSVCPLANGVEARAIFGSPDLGTSGLLRIYEVSINTTGLLVHTLAGFGPGGSGVSTASNAVNVSISEDWAFTSGVTSSAPTGVPLMAAWARTGTGIWAFQQQVPGSNATVSPDGSTALVQSSPGVIELWQLRTTLANQTGTWIQSGISGPGELGETMSGQFASTRGGVLREFDCVGDNYCMANANSTGVAASISATGSLNVADNDVTLACVSLPTMSFGYFLVAPVAGFVPGPNGSSGNLCLAGSIGRFLGPGQILNSGNTGMVELAIDLTMIPNPIGPPLAASALDQWFFQYWFRDTNGMGGLTSNFSDGLEIEFNF